MVLVNQTRRVNPASDCPFDLQADGLAEVKDAEEQQIQGEVGQKKPPAGIVEDIDLYLPDAGRQAPEHLGSVSHDIDGANCDQAQKQGFEEVGPGSFCVSQDAFLIDGAVPFEANGQNGDSERALHPGTRTQSRWCC